MEKTSLILWSKEHESFQKLDYFLCGVAGALFAYIGQTYTPHKLDFWYFWLMPLALLCLTICFMCGLRRLQLACKVTESNRKSHFAAEQSSYYYDILVEHAKDPQRRTFNRHTNKEQTVAELEQLLKKFQMEKAEFETKWQNEESWADFFGNVRTLFLIFGFILILASKVLQPYFG
jgi:hypothetical protein